MRQHRIGDEARAPGVDMAVTSATLAVREEALRHHQMKWSLAHDVQQQRGEIWQHSRDVRLSTLAVRSLTRAREFCEPLRGGLRAEFHGLFVPLTGLRNIGNDADGAELLDDERVKCRAKHQCGTRAAGLGGAAQQKPRRDEITALQRIRSAVDERGDLLGVEVPGRAASLRRQRLRPGDGCSPSLNARHWRWPGLHYRLVGLRELV
jgi:hypothetical protein